MIPKCIVSLLLSLMLLGNTFAQSHDSLNDDKIKDSNNVFTVSDESRGLTITLENIDGHTLVTNLQTGEKILEKGEFAHTFTAIEFSQILDKKEEKARLRESVRAEKLSASGTWSINGKPTNEHPPEGFVSR